MTDQKLPALRPIEIVPFRDQNGRLYFALHDQTQLAPRALAVSPAAVFVLAHLDGNHSCAEIQLAFRQASGEDLPANEILDLVRVLDEGLFLRGQRAEEASERRRNAYHNSPTRDNRERYPDAVGLRQQIERVLAGGVAAPVSEVRGLIAPHLDYERGAPCYADAYATLAQVLPVDRFVILGTNHFGRPASVVATTKDFQTPFGRVPTDRNFVCELERRLGMSLCEDQVDHLSEHSVELQLHILQVLMAERPFSIVPILCSDPGIAADPAGVKPRGPGLADFAAALGQLIEHSDYRTIVIAGADLSHVGQRFGDADRTSPAMLEEVARSDRFLLWLLEARDEEGFLNHIRATGNPTRICSVASIFALLRALPGRPCRVLSYHQAVNAAAETNVTCVAAVVT